MILAPSIRSGPEYRQKVPPANPRVGCTWYDLTAHALKVWNGADWDIVAQYDPPGAHFGYMACGRTTPYTTFLSSVEMIQFPFDSGQAAMALYNVINSEGTCGSNSSVAGYFHTNQTEGGTYTSSIARFKFPFGGGRCRLVASTHVPLNGPTGTNSSAAMYVHHGSAFIEGVSVPSSTIEKLEFALDEGVTSKVGTLAENNRYGASFTDGSGGYFCGGTRESDPSVTSTVQRFNFPFDVVTVLSVTLPQAVGLLLNSSCNSTAFGYVCAGKYVNEDGSVSYYLSTVQRLSFPYASATAVLAGSLTAAGPWPTGFNSTTHGYVASARTVTSIERFSFPFDSGVAIHVGNVSHYRHEAAGIDGVDFVTQFVS